MKPSTGIKSLDRNERIFKTVSFALFCICFCFLYWFLNNNLDRLINSDDSSELILSRLLAEENSLLSSNWFYSTELRVFNTQIVYAFLFKFFNNWHKIRLVSEIFMSLLMALSAYWLFSVFKLKKYAWIGMTIMILPTSINYFEIVLKGAYYYPHIVISILTVAAIEYRKNIKDKKLLSFVLLFAVCLLAFLAGLGGPRQILAIYLPLIVTVFVLLIFEVSDVFKGGEKNIRQCIKSALNGGGFSVAEPVLAFVFSVAGYLINMTFLRLYFDYYSYSINFRSISVNRLRDVVAFYFMNFGYTDGKLFTVNLIHNMICFVWIGLFIVSLVAGLRRKEKGLYFRFSLLTTVTFLIYVLAFLFTDVNFKDRHSLVLLWMSLPCIFFWFEEIRNKVNLKYVPVILFSGLFLLTGACRYKTLFERDDLSELRKITTFLIENGYKDGYATFWNGNVLTELSNGYLDVRVNAVEAGIGDNCDKTFEWLQLKSHVSGYPEGKVFCVVSEDQRNDSILLRNVPSDHLIYVTLEDVNWDIFDEEKLIKRYFVYGFSSYDEFYSMTGNITISNNYTVAPGKKYQTRNVELYPDEYYAIVTGSDLDSLDFSVIYNPVVVKNFNKTTWNRPHEVSSKVVSKGEDHVVLSYKLDEQTKTLRIAAQNNGGSSSCVENVQIIKRYVYHSDFYSSQFLEGGADNKGTRVLNPDGVSFGPEMTLVPGTYVMEVEGTALADTEVSVTHKVDGAARTIQGKAVTHTDNRIEYEFTVTETIDNCEFKVTNNTDKPCVLNFIRVRFKE